MKEYLKQIYNEGFATTFYQKPLNFLTKNIKNKTVIKLLSITLKVIYTLFIIAFASYVLYRKLPK